MADIPLQRRINEKTKLHCLARVLGQKMGEVRRAHDEHGMHGCCAQGILGPLRLHASQSCCGALMFVKITFLHNSH